MNAQHTPGPWVVKRPSFGRGLFIAQEQVNTVRLSIAKVTSDDEDREEADANLLAAAPELLDALRGMLAMAPSVDVLLHPACISARAAIAKATGGAA